MTEARTRVMVFARAPIAGTVKTRLIPTLGREQATRLHERLVRRTVSTVAGAGLGTVELWCTPTAEHPFFEAMQGVLPVALLVQRGGDLGERMARAFDHALARAPRALLVGSDCRDLQGGDVQEAEAALLSGCEAVLGPAADGGYVLIGLRRAAPDLFAGMPWGTPEVLARTRERLVGQGWRWHELPIRHDVDRPEDLAGIDL